MTLPSYTCATAGLQLFCRLCVVLVMLLPVTPVSAHGPRFERLFTDAEAAGEGVGAIRVIVQDGRGFIWLGGENGLARYDGVRLKRYFSDPRVPNTLTSSYVRDLQIDHDGVLWVATDLGLCRYNEVSDNFTAFVQGTDPLSISHNVVMSLSLDARNNLYLGTGDGLNILDPERESFQRYFPQPASGNNSGTNSVQEVFVDNRERVWLGMGDLGLVLFSPNPQDQVFFQHRKNDPASIVSDSVLTLEQDSRGRLWIGTYGGGLSRMNDDGRTFTNYLHDPSDPRSLGSNSIWDIFEDSHGALWIATDPGGLARYDHTTDTFIHSRHSPYNPDSLSSNVVRTVFEDNRGDLWVGTFPSGVNFHSRASSRFTNYFHKPDDTNSLSHSAVLSFLEDREGTIWIGNEGGLDSFDSGTRTFTRHNKNQGNPGGLRASAVLSIEEDYNDDLWLGTWSGGLYRYDRKSGIFHSYYPDKESPGSINSAFIWSILRDRNNDLWIGTETGGLNRYDRETDSFTAYSYDPSNPDSISGDFIWALLEDSRGNFWVGTINGLDRFDRATGKFTHYAENSANPEAFNRVIRIRALAEDRRGRIWIGTQDNGAFVYDPGTDSFTRLDETKGMPSPYVPSIVEDGLGYIWLTTGNGVARVNPDTFAITAYRKGHGLAGNNFNRNATLRDRHGNIYLGGADGFSVIDPRSLGAAKQDFPVVITDFRIFNRPVELGVDGSPLERSILQTDVITLTHRHSMFSFDFAGLSYRSANRNQYAYTLEGFDKGWNHTGTDNTATYTNIGAGRYVFKVKAADGDGLWSSTVASKTLIVLPPPWKTWWAYSLYALALLCLGALAFRFKARRMEFENQRAINQELMRVNRIKDTFLANTSHELRTPLNGIIGIAESLADDPHIRSNDNAFHRLNLIVFSGKRLSSLINDILDYSKLSDRKLELFYQPVDLKTLVDDVFQLLAPLSEAKGIVLENAVAPDLKPVHADENRLQQIMINLVGNSIKYSDAGRVRVYGRPLTDAVEIVVEDTGAGIPEAQFENVFKAFHQLESSDSRRHGGTGLGLTVTKQLVELHGSNIRVESRVGVGSKFIFALAFSHLSLAEADHISRRPAPQPVRRTATPQSRTKKPVVATVDDLTLGPAPEHAENFTILVVDDDPVNRMVLSGILGLHRYRVIEAANGLDAIEIVRRASPVIDLVVLDVMMPNMNGYQTCELMRQDYSIDELPVIFLTAKKVDKDIASAFAAGGTEILTKPVSKYEILPRIANHLRLLEVYRRAANTVKKSPR